MFKKSGIAENKKVRTNFDPEEFISDPSPASLPLIQIVQKHSDAFDALFSSKNPLKVFSREVKMGVYLREDFKSFFSLLSQYHLPELPPEQSARQEGLLKEFDKLYKQVIWNNVAIAYLFAKGEKVESRYQTKEDEKNILLQKIARGEEKPDVFRQQYGQYSLEPFEVTSRRFSSYSDEEIAALGQNFLQLSFPQKKVLTEEDIKKANRATIDMLIVIREMGKYTAVGIVAGMRNESAGGGRQRRSQKSES